MINNELLHLLNTLVEAKKAGVHLDDEILSLTTLIFAVVDESNISQVRLSPYVSFPLPREDAQ